MALIENLNAAVHAHEHAAALLADGVAEGVIRTDYCGMACQARLDWLNPAARHRRPQDLRQPRLAADWTPAPTGTPTRWRSTGLFWPASSGTVLPVYLIAVEKREPFRCGVWRMGEDVLGIAQKENEEAIARLKECRERDHWPTGYEDIRVFDWI